MTLEEMLHMLTADSDGWPTELDPRDKEWLVAKLRAADELCEAAYRAYEANYTDNLLGYIEAYENAGKGE